MSKASRSSAGHSIPALRNNYRIKKTYNGIVLGSIRHRLSITGLVSYSPPLNSFPEQPEERHEGIKQAYLNELRTRGHKVEDLIDNMARLLAIGHSPANQDGEG